MLNIQNIFLCSTMTIRKWGVNPRIYSIFILLFVFLLYHSYGLYAFSEKVGHRISPWLFSHLTSSPVLQIFAFFAVLLYCDAPFQDRHSPFVMIRTGRMNWIISQIVYIFFSSFIYTFFIFCSSILVILPRVVFQMEWDTIMVSLARDVSLASNNVTIFFNPLIIDTITPIYATLIGFLFFWMGTTFIGMTTFCFNIMFRNMAGIVASGIFIGISYFSNYLGFLVFGYTIFYFSPLSWMSISNIDITGQTSLPSPLYCFVILVTSIIVMGIIAVTLFNKQDITNRVGGN